MSGYPWGRVRDWKEDEGVFWGADNDDLSWRILLSAGEKPMNCRHDLCTFLHLCYDSI